MPPAVAAPNVPNRIQQTRRDADSVIEEVLAEAAVADDADAGRGAGGRLAAGGGGGAARARRRGDGGATPHDDTDSSDAPSCAFERSADATPTRADGVDRRRLELLVAKNGDALVVGGGAATPPSHHHFERVRLDSTLTS